MRISVLALFVVAAAPLNAAQVRLNGHLFTLPDGFEIELVAGPPLVNRPITVDFDDEGRLYVSDSSGSNDRVQIQLEQKPHRIVRLDDRDGDGVFERSTVFADRMMFPEGTLWHAGSLFVSAPPSIWKLTDMDGDGVADQREEWFQGKTLTNCANDLHGPYLGPDGWIYWCKGAFAEQTYLLRGKPWKTKSSHIFRCRPDGSGLEPVMTGGMDNPVDTVFLRNGDRVFTTTFMVHPGNGQRDGLIHAIYGGVYGKDHGALEGHPRTGELMPPLSHLGAAAPCGLTRYESNVFGDEYTDNLFAAQFNLHKVSRHVLASKGSSYTSTDSDFVVSDNLDFHPTDVLIDADGSLIIVDTGGWYKLCCPTSQLDKPDILGGIYRVRRTGSLPPADPRGRTLSWSTLSSRELVQTFSDVRPAVRHRGMAEFGKRFAIAGSFDAVAQEFSSGAQAVAHGARREIADSQLLWALTRIDARSARDLILRHLAAEEASDLVRQVALQSVSLWRDREAVPLLLDQLHRGSPTTRRLAAEALGRIGDASAAPGLLAAAGSLGTMPAPGGASIPADRALEHSFTYALIELSNPVATAPGLASENPWTRRAALIALDQMGTGNGGLQAEQVTPMLASADPLLREAAHWIVGRHADWGDHLASYFIERLTLVATDEPSARAAGQAPSPADLAAAELEQRLVQFAGNATIEAMLARCILDSSRIPPAGQRMVLRAMANSKPREMPASWGASLAKLISTIVDGDVIEQPPANDQLLAAAIAAARGIPQPKKSIPELNAALAHVANNERIAVQPRLDAMAAIASGMPALTESQFQLLLASLLPDKSVETRSAAADGIARAQLAPDQLDRLTDTIKSVGPLELDRLLAPFERSTEERAGLKLVAALQQSLSLSSLRLDSLQQKLAKYSPVVQQGVADLAAKINVEAAQQKQRLEQLLPGVASGDIRRGQAVFNSTKSACIACHRFGYLGGSSGPDLTRIGSIRSERDLLEAILYPSLSFVRSYEPVVVITVDGRAVNGLIRNETSNELVLVTGTNQEVKIARAEIDEVRPGTISVMPTGLDKQLSTQELSDLVAFLKNAR